MVFRLLYFLFLFQECTNLLPSLKPPLNQTISLSRSSATVLIINSDIQIGLPCMYFNTNLHIPHIADQVCDSGEVYLILNSVEEKVFEKVKKMVRYCLAESHFLVLEKPSETSFQYLENNGIYKIQFLETSQMSVWPSSNRTFKVCYTVHVPYTTIDNLHSYGLESLIIKQSGTFAGLSVEFIKHTEFCTSGGPMGVFDHLKNRSCDVVIGAVMCPEILPFIASSPYFLEDGTLLVTPNVKCSRQLFTTPIIAASLWVFISLISVEISQIKLKISIQNISIKLFITAPLLLLTVVLFGYLQAQLYDVLVTDKHKCGVKSLEDIVEKKIFIGIEPPLIQVFELLGVPNVNLKTLKKYLIPDKVVDLTIQMESDKSHVIRTILFKYLVPRYYLKENGDIKFRIVQTIHRRSYLLHVRKGYPYMKDLNLGIIKLQESGISKYLEKQVTGYMDLKYIIKRSTLLSYFTPVKMQEFYWLLIFVLIMWVVSILVFLLEIYSHNRNKML